MRYKKSETSIATIVSAATRVLARQGYANSSLMDIAREAGMSKGAVHYHFPSKDALIATVLRQACDAVAEKTLEAWRGEGSIDERMRRGIDALWSVRQERGDDFRVVANLLAQSLHEPALRPVLAEYYRFAADQVRDNVVSQLVALGFRPRVPLEVLPRILIAVLDGLAMQIVVDDEGTITKEDVMTALESMVISIIEVTPSPPSPAREGAAVGHPSDPPLRGGQTA